MRILYGVQATGNGHITRARAMARAFKDTDIKVDYLFSGREKKLLFNMEPFGDYQHREGMTFVTKNGEVQYFDTALKNNPIRLIRDVLTLKLSDYDLVITDFEPVTAWAARLRQKPLLGIGHQYAFSHNVPNAGTNVASHLVMKYFAPAKRSLGVHWHHYNGAILPPLIEPPQQEFNNNPDKVLVYLPFECVDDVVSWLIPFDSPQFYVYHNLDKATSLGNIHLRPYSRETFPKDLADCSGVVCSAGFGLVSESIQAGKKLLVKPVKGQMEQLSNAKALQELGIGDVFHEFDEEILDNWLSKPDAEPCPYPDVAKAIVSWIESDFEMSEMELVNSVWAELTNRIQTDLPPQPQRHKRTAQA